MQIVAQSAPAAAPTSAPTGEPPGWTNIVPIVLLVFVFWFFMLRPRKGEQKKRDDLIASLKKGDEVQTIGGVFGRVMEIRDDRVQLKVDEGTNTKIWYSRSAIHKVVTEEKAEAK